jgi:hypothetical protein
MTHEQAAASAEKKLLARRIALTRQRIENDASVLELNGAKRLDELAENDVCGRAIDSARLTALPEARTCVDCTRSNR